MEHFEDNRSRYGCCEGGLLRLPKLNGEARQNPYGGRLMGDPRIQSNSASHWLLTLLLKDSSLV